MVGEPQAVDLKAAWQCLSDLGAAERHFNEIQSRYRAIASTWLLAGFAGMGFVVTNKDLRLPYEPIVFGIGLAVAVGVSLLWILDEIVFRNLLSANFLEGLRLEKKYTSLPQVRHTMLRLFQGGLPVRRYVGIFYAVAVLVPTLAGFSVAFYWLWRPQALALKAFFFLIMAAILLVAVKMCTHRRNSEYVKLLAEMKSGAKPRRGSGSGAGVE